MMTHFTSDSDRARSRSWRLSTAFPLGVSGFAWGSTIFRRRLRWGLAIGLTASITLDTLLQVVWKSAVLETPADASPLDTLAGIFTNPLFIGMIAIMTLQFFNWLAVLRQADLSFAKPINAMSYVSVPLFSLAVLDEAVDIVKLAGAALVITGVWFVSQSTSQTQKVSGRP